MKIIKERIFDGKNIYSNRKIVRIDIDFEGYSETPTKEILNFDSNFSNIISQIKKSNKNIDFTEMNLMDLMDLKHVYKLIMENLENRLTLNIRFKEFKRIDKEVYYLIIEYKYENATLEICKLTVDLINSLIKDEIENIEEKVKLIKSFKIKETIEPSLEIIINKAKQKNMPVIRLGKSNFYQIGYGKMGKIFNNNLGERVKAVSVELTCDKLLVSEILKNQHIPIIHREKIESDNKLLDLANKLGYPVVLKNQYKTNIENTILNIQNERELLKAYKTIDKDYKDVILEKHVVGKSFRVCVVDYNVVGVVLRTAPFVIGDGKKSVKDLIQDLNKDKERENENSKFFNKIKICENLLNCLGKQGITISSIPIKTEKVHLSENPNISLGGTAEDFTDKLCEENKKICEKVAKVLGLDICCIDICTEDISKSLNKTGLIINVSTTLDIAIHEFAYKGQKRDVSGAILNMMYENYIENIPLLSIVGENGQETIVKGINYVLSKMGYIVGAKTKDKIIINNCYINIENNTDKVDAKSILLNKEVDIGILGITKEEVVSKGIDYDLCDVAIIKDCNFLNKEVVSDLELGELLIINSVKDDGFVVVNLDNCNNLTRLNEIKCRKIFFSMDSENSILKENIQLGEPVVYIDNEIMYVENNNKKYMICKIKDIPIISKEKIKEDVENAMAICAGLVGLKVDYCMIAKGLKFFENRLCQII